MLIATELREKVKSENNQRLAIAKFTNQLYWIPREKIEAGQLPSEEVLEGNVIYLRPIADHYFANRPTRIMEIGGIASEVIVVHNHEFPYEAQLSKEDFFTAIERAVRTSSVSA